MTKTDAPDAAAPTGNDANGSVEEVSKVMQIRSAESLATFYSYMYYKCTLPGRA